MAGLLAGLRVLDLTNVLAGPFCCYQLAQLGAEVIKIETPGTGDLARQLGADPELNRRLMGASFLAQNAGKRSITLNLKHIKAREAFTRPVDIMIRTIQLEPDGAIELRSAQRVRRMPGQRQQEGRVTNDR